MSLLERKYLACARSVAGGQIMMSASGRGSIARRSCSDLTSARSAVSPCIFQLPATSGLIAVTVLPPSFTSPFHPCRQAVGTCDKPLCSLENGALPPYVLLPMMRAPHEQSPKIDPSARRLQTAKKKVSQA